MAIFHSSTQIISRSKGKSSVGASAYRSGEKIYNERDGIEHDYRRKKGVVFKEILAPENSPKWVKNRARLWNEVEKIEKRKDSQLAREINIALPIEFDRDKQIKLLREYVNESFVSMGMIADVVIHDTDNGNPHAHIMLTMREITEDGFGKKNRDWNNRVYIEKWREELANHINKGLKEMGLDERVDHRSYEEQGIEKIPTKHEGHIVRAMERRGIKTDRGNENREILEQNEMLELINENYEILVSFRGDINGKQGFRRIERDEQDIEITERRAGKQRVFRDTEEVRENRELSIRDRSNSREFGRDEQRIREKGRAYLDKLKKDRELAERREREAREFEERYKRELERRRREEERTRRCEKSNNYEMGM